MIVQRFYHVSQAHIGSQLKRITFVVYMLMLSVV